MKKSLITELLSMSDDELKNYLLVNIVDKSEFNKNIEDMKVNALLNKNREFFNELSVFKTKVTDILDEPKEVKLCMESKLRSRLGKMFVSLVFLVLFASCEGTGKTYVVTSEDELYDTYIIDSCEYIGWLGGNASYLTHKGNCKFCKFK